MWNFFSKKMELDGLNQALTELISKVQTLEHALGEEREQLRAAYINSIQAMENTLREEIRRAFLPPDFSSLRTEFTSKVKMSEQAIVKEIQPLRASPELLQKILTELGQLQQQVHDLAQLVAHLSPILPSGELKPMHPLIEFPVKRAEAALTTLSSTLTDWLIEHTRYQQETWHTISELQNRHQLAMKHILSPEQEQPAVNSSRLESTPETFFDQDKLGPGHAEGKI